MMTRVYLFIWAMVAAVAGLIFLTGYLNVRSFLAIGVVLVALVFIGIMGILPSTIGGNSRPGP